jgi:preprotein translocase subunit YajC
VDRRRPAPRVLWTGAARLLPARFTVLPPPPRTRIVFLVSDAFAQTAGAAASTGAPDSSMFQMITLVGIFAVMYFIMIRPQMKKQKEMKSLLESLAKGDEVVTVGGMLGRITKIGDNFLTVEIAPGVEIQVQRSAVVQVLPKGSLKSA